MHELPVFNVIAANNNISIIYSVLIITFVQTFCLKKRDVLKAKVLFYIFRPQL